MIKCREYNFDGLVGPTHNYAGLSFGNVASQFNAKSISNPKLAAKQGLQKMRLLHNLGIPQAVLPPQLRPNLQLLRNLGFSGTTEYMLQRVQQINPALLAAVYSAASMWTANMATISPSCDTADGLLHITPANLTYNFHRAQEAEFSYKLLSKIFANERYFKVHTPLPAYRDLSDEGAANHSVLCNEYGMPGLELFVYGRHGLDDKMQTERHFPPRQSQLASIAILQNHGIKADCSLMLQQNPAAIDAGVFHNDVVFVANKNVILMHEDAFVDSKAVQTMIAQFFGNDCSIIVIPNSKLSLQTAVETYLFNSQIVSVNDQEMALIVPNECKESRFTSKIIDEIVDADNPIKKVYYVECRQSMRNGGGPACLRLRAILTPEQEQQIPTGIILTPDLYMELDAWIDKHYRDQLMPEDLLDPNLELEVLTALDALTKILHLGQIYPFQEV